MSAAPILTFIFYFDILLLNTKLENTPLSAQHAYVFFLIIN